MTTKANCKKARRFKNVEEENIQKVIEDSLKTRLKYIEERKITNPKDIVSFLDFAVVRNAAACIFCRP